ncbi:galactose-1-phosphate uridylyltransferase [Saccharothrix sp. ST-888]|uniref:galactose-1-phosphate uridylyltransferase n=1 Tax=Saccharothrix sp. ST-888 TaxID=1427391 RepID=UPI0006977F85|nr:hypothetical protein [Saccharothrix sp. ST-888]
MNKTTTKLADGRELLYYDTDDTSIRDVLDPRPLEPTTTLSEIRRDPATGDWVTIAAHRQGRTYHPPADQCPLCPSRNGRPGEIPAGAYEVAVFENRFPHSRSTPPPTSAAPTRPSAPAHPPRGGARSSASPPTTGRASPTSLRSRPAWTDRTADLAARPGVQQVYCFENRGAEIGVTLAHPHGQIAAFPFVTPRTERVITAAAEHRARTGGNLFENLLAAERADGTHVVLAGEHWTAFVPFAARWPYEVHLYPHRRVPDLTHLDEAERAEFPGLYLELLRPG